MLLALGIAPEAGAVNIALSGPTTSVITGVGLEEVFAEDEITFTFSLDVPSDVQGYGLIVGWDPSELELVGSQELLSGGLFDFTRGPDPLEPGGTRVIAVFGATASGAVDLFSLTFRAIAPSLDGLPDLSWIPEDNGLGPPEVVLTNPAGAGIDVAPSACLPGDDPDGDDLCTSDGDNCPNEANADQADLDEDGIGNVCECGNADGNASVDIFDALHIAQGTLQPPVVVIVRPRACDADGNGACDIFDALRVAQATLTPPLGEIVQECEAATVPPLSP